MKTLTKRQALVLYIILLIIKQLFILATILSFAYAFFRGIPMWYQFVILVYMSLYVYVSFACSYTRALWLKVYFGDIVSETLSYTHILVGHIFMIGGVFSILEMVRQLGSSTRDTNYTIEHFTEILFGLLLFHVGFSVSRIYREKIKAKYKGPFPLLMWSYSERVK